MAGNCVCSVSCLVNVCVYGYRYYAMVILHKKVSGHKKTYTAFIILIMEVHHYVNHSIIIVLQKLKSELNKNYNITHASIHCTDLW